MVESFTVFLLVTWHECILSSSIEYPSVINQTISISFYHYNIIINIVINSFIIILKSKISSKFQLLLVYSDKSVLNISDRNKKIMKTVNSNR